MSDLVAAFRGALTLWIFKGTGQLVAPPGSAASTETNTFHPEGARD